MDSRLQVELPIQTTLTDRNNDTNRLQTNPPGTPTPPPGANIHATRPPELTTLPDTHIAASRHSQFSTPQYHNINIEKLYEDNCILAHTVNVLNERLSIMNAPQNAQLRSFAEMQEKLRASEASRAAIHQKYTELLRPTSSADSQRRLLFEELQAAQAAYSQLQRDHRVLVDKYYMLKGQVFGETNRNIQQQPQSDPRSVPIAHHTQVRAHNQSQNIYATSTSMTSASFQHPVDPTGNHRRRSSENIQSPLRSAPVSMATTWSAPLPTHPPSASIAGQGLPQGVPVHARIPARSLPLPHHPQVNYDPRAASGVPVVAPPQHVGQHAASEPSIAAMIRQRCCVPVDLTNTTNGSVTFAQQPPVQAPLASPRPLKRPNSGLQIQTPAMAVMEQHKRPRIVEVESDRPTTTMSAATHPLAADKLPSPPASAESLDERKASEPVSNLRPYEDCVYTIFEKDANVENGVFCGLCLGRYERAPDKLEPPEILIEPDFNLLVEHCKTAHPTAWDDLLHGRS